MRRRGLLVACLLLAAAAPPEPAGFWTGPMQGAVPATLAGATVLATAAAAQAFLTQHQALPIDVGPAPERPATLAPGLPWLPAAHQDIPGSLWLPGAGSAVLQPARAAAFRTAVAARTGGDGDRVVLVYCHADCWGSWNAAKCLVQAGYRHVAWFPPGVEGWAAADLPFQRTAATPY
jgi:PQQ-dependent catabolism-associated CXXCW motif protein